MRSLHPESSSSLSGRAVVTAAGSCIGDSCGVLLGLGSQSTTDHSISVVWFSHSLKATTKVWAGLVPSKAAFFGLRMAISPLVSASSRLCVSCEDTSQWARTTLRTSV